MKNSNINKMIHSVYEMLQDREINPTGTFDKQGRFYAEHGDLISVRSPSKNFPYSQMSACRSLKYVKKVQEKYNIRSVKKLIKEV